MKHLLVLLVILSGCALKPAAPSSTEPKVDDPVLATIPFTLHDNRILVDVFLNNLGPFLMIFDTGGANTITPEVQKVLDLKSQGLEFATGAGEKTVSAHSVHLNSLRVGGFHLENQRFMVINLNSIRKTFHFPHLDGIVGLELLQQARVKIDFDHNIIQVLKSGAPELANAQRVPFILKDGSPIVEGKINNQPAKILIDTGDRSNLTLFHKFAARSELAKMFDSRETIVTGMGIGGPIKGKLTSMPSVDLGSAELHDILTRLPLTKGGYFYQSDVSASAGIGLLKAFNLEFDYKNQTLALQKRKDFKEESTFVPVVTRIR